MRRFIPSLTALQAFERSARHSNFTRAASDLAITQSGVSRQIANLERQLGTRLFERSGSRLVLTEAGANYLREIASILDRLEEASIDLVRGRSADTSLRVGAPPTFAARWLAPRLVDFVAKHPAVPIEVVRVSSEVDLEAADTDITILRGTGAWPGLRADKLFGEELAVVAAPTLVAVAGQRLAEFGYLPMLQNAQRPGLWLQWLHLSGFQHAGPIQGVRFAGSEMLIAAAVSGLGMAVIPKPYIEGEIARGDLCLLYGPARLTDAGFWLVTAERRTQKGNAMLFRRWVQQQARMMREQ